MAGPNSPVPRFASARRRASDSRWTRENGLELLGLEGVVYNPLTGQFNLSPKDIDVNYLAAFEKPAE